MPSPKSSPEPSSESNTENASPQNFTHDQPQENQKQNQNTVIEIAIETASNKNDKEEQSDSNNPAPVIRIQITLSNPLQSSKATPQKDEPKAEDSQKSRDLESEPMMEAPDPRQLMRSLAEKLASSTSAGGLIIQGRDRKKRLLHQTHAGLQAMKVFSKIGQLKPIYLSEDFYKAMGE